MTQSREQPRSAMRRIIAGVIKTNYDVLKPAQRSDFARADVANKIIIALEKAGWMLNAPPRIY